MDNYKKVSSVRSSYPEYEFISKNCVHMKVKNGSKIRNILEFSFKKINAPNFEQIAFWGDDKAITKALTCAERMKKVYQPVLYQISKIFYNTVVEKYEPNLPDIETLEVTRNIPSILILLSKSPFNFNGLQYQSSQMNVDDIVYNKSDGRAIKVLKKVKRQENYPGRLRNCLLNDI